MKLEDWQKHINRTDDYGMAWCGQSIAGEWCFVDADHALLTVAQGQRLQACPACADALIKVLRNMDRGQFPALLVSPFGESVLTTSQRSELARELGIDVAAAKRAGVGLGILDGGDL